VGTGFEIKSSERSCQDVQGDGTHPAVPGGRIKVASILLNFFKTDGTASPWFLSPSASTQ